MSIMYGLIHSNLFLFNACSHLLLAILFGYANREYMAKMIKNPSYILEKTGTIAFVLGHTLISIAQFTLSYRDTSLSEFIKYVGMVAHSLLLVYVLANLRSGKVFYFSTFMFVVGQLGMIYFYLHHRKPNKIIFENNKYQLKNRNLFIYTFAILFLYYLYKVTMESKLYKYGFIAVTYVYLGLFMSFSLLS